MLDLIQQESVEELRSLAPIATEVLDDKSVLELRELIYRLAEWMLEEMRQHPDRFIPDQEPG